MRHPLLDQFQEHKAQSLLKHERASDMLVGTGRKSSGRKALKLLSSVCCPMRYLCIKLLPVILTLIMDIAGSRSQWGRTEYRCRC